MRQWLTHRRGVLVSAALVAMTVFVYWQTAGFTFVAIDDETYLMARPHLWDGLTLENLGWAFSTTYFSNWHPLTWLSYLLDMELFGHEDPGAFHLTNVVLHVANILLLFILFRQMTGDFWQSAFVAAVFAVHPLRVESVAWVSERKDVLSTLFGFLSLIAYTHYAQQGQRKWFWMAWVAYALSLMAKQTLVTLPFLFLLLDYWPLARMKSGTPAADAEPSPTTARRKSKSRQRDPAPSAPRTFRALVLEKWPFFLLTIAGCAIALFAQQQGKNAVVSLETLSLWRRLENVVVVYGLYLMQTVWPTGLVPFYPFPPGGVTTGEVAFWGSVLSAITIAAVWQMRRHPYVLVGWLWFLGTLVPVIGIVQIGMQRMADRYMYVPGIGLVIIAAWLIPALVPAGVWRRAVVPAAAIGVLLALMVAAHRQTGYWANSIVLFERTIAVDPDSAFIHYRFGRVLVHQNQTDRAIAHYQEAVRLQPDLWLAHFYLGLALTGRGQLDDAVHHFEETLRIRPADVDAHFNLGAVLHTLGRNDEALTHLREAARLNPHDLVLQSNVARIADSLRNNADQEK